MPKRVLLVWIAAHVVVFPLRLLDWSLATSVQAPRFAFTPTRSQSLLGNSVVGGSFPAFLASKFKAPSRQPEMLGELDAVYLDALVGNWTE